MRTPEPRGQLNARDVQRNTAQHNTSGFSYALFWGGGGGGGGEEEGGEGLMRAQFAILYHTTGLHQSQGLPYPPDRLHLRDVQDNYWGQPGPI